MEQQDHLLSNKTYNLLKGVVTLGLPAFATFYAAMDALWGWPNSDAVVGTCAALAVFLGVLLTISTNSWNKSEAKFDGAFVPKEIDPVTGHPKLDLLLKDPLQLADKDYIRIKTDQVVA